MPVGKMRLIIVVATLLVVVLANKSYNGYKVYDVTTVTKEQEKILSQFYNNDGYDFWTGLKRVGYKSTVMIAPQWQKTFISIMDLYKIEYHLVINNVEITIEKEKLDMKVAPKLDKGRISFDSYHSHVEINDYLRQLETDYPDVVTLETIGTSYEEREMIAIKICSGVCGSKPGILIEGGIHAREWIGPAMVTYIIQELVENAANRALVETLDWYILPSTNPDGYEYSRSTNRMWRKTRRHGISICDGTDANRNFDYFWMHAGASDNECSDIFAGPEPFSESETRAFRDWTLANAANIKLYLAMHSCGQVILYPWGYDEILPDNADELQALGDAVSDAIYAVNGTLYDVGNSAILLYAGAGATDDWCKGVAGIELSYTFELPCGDIQGFDLPPSRIRPVVEETWEGMKAYADYIINKFGKK